jgi:hypothetical protein
VVYSSVRRPDQGVIHVDHPAAITSLGRWRLIRAHTTRLSCHRFQATEVRLLLGVIAYNRGNLLGRLVLPFAIQNWSLTSLQQRLFETGGRPIRHARYFVLQLAESHLTGSLFRLILRRIERLAGHPT